MASSKFNWTTEVEYFGEQLKPDEFGRSKYASYLTDLLIKKSSKGNYVLNLNSEWGSGKTYFIKRWAKELANTHPVVYIDAWKQDYSDDPLLTVISSIVSQLKSQAGPELEQMTQKVFGNIVGLLKATAPAVTGAIVKKYIGVDINELIENIKGEGPVTTVVNSDGKPIDLSNAASAVVTHIIKEHEEKGKSIEALKKAIDEWIGAVIGKSGVKSPAFIFIDELDRCRPSYAVEMLETIKHLFNVSQAVFIIATDTEQLQHAIKVIYGDEFEARAYLGRFFNARYALNKPNFSSYIKSYYGAEFDEVDLGSFHLCSADISIVDNLSSIVSAFSISARNVAKIIERLLIIIDNHDRYYFNIYYISILLCIFERGDYDSIESVEGSLKNQSKLEQSFFDNFGDVNWTRRVKVHFDRRRVGMLIPEFGKAILGRMDVSVLEISLQELFLTIHNCYCVNNPGRISLSATAEISEREVKMLENDLAYATRNTLLGGYLYKSEVLKNYIEILIASDMDEDGFEVQQILDMVYLSCSFESLT